MPLLPIALLWCWIGIINRLPAPPLVISKEITYITSPLTADGHLDFFKALEERVYPPEFATDDNGYRIFVRLFGYVGDAEPEDREFYRRQTYEKLGLDPDIPTTLVLPEEPDKVIEEFHKANGEVYREDSTLTSTEITQLLERENEQYDKDGKKYRERENNQWDRPWTLEEFPMLADWIKEIDEPLDAIAEAIRKPIFCFPLLQTPESVQSGQPKNLLSMPLSIVVSCRSIARLFRVRAMYRIGQGDIDGAIEDKLTMHRLGRQIHQNGQVILVQYIVSISIEGMATVIPVNANPEHPLTERHIRRILDGYDALPPHTPVTDAYEGDRFVGLSALQEVMDDEERKHSFSRLFGMSRYDWNIVYRRVNDMYDALQEPPPLVRFHDIIETAETRLEQYNRIAWRRFVLWLTPRNFENVVADLLIGLWSPAAEFTEGAVLQRDCLENLQRLTWAILLYQCEHGKLPDENWTEQIKPYLGENPEQYFSCPANPCLQEQTTYAMIQYGDALPTEPHTLLLIELPEAVPLDKAVIAVDDVIAMVKEERIKVHPGGMTAAYRSGAVNLLSQSMAERNYVASWDAAGNNAKERRT